jgi:hypothetical protein
MSFQDSFLHVLSCKRQECPAAAFKNKTENPSSPYLRALYYFTAFLLNWAKMQTLEDLKSMILNHDFKVPEKSIFDHS